MEENVALDSTKQRKFVKSIKGIKKLIKKNEKNEVKTEVKKKDEQTKPEKPFSMRLKDGQIRKKKRFQRGLVYLSHIPHGFYEHQMTQYFKQFGVVTNARVIKSKRTGNSKGYAFVEFKEPSVAQIVAETMNNYLMGKRLIKAVYIPPEKIRRKAFRKKWNSLHNPTSLRRMKLNKAFNAEKSDDEDLKKARKLLASLNKTMKKLSALGINYEFFTPVDVPKLLLDRIIKKEKDDVKEKIESVSKKGKKKHDDQVDTKTIKSEKQINVKKASKANKVEETSDLIEVSKKKKKEQQKQPLKEDRKDKKSSKLNEKEQKDKEQKLKDAGVKSVEEFISVDAEDSDESCEFDSDEFEKMLQDDDDDSDQSNDDSEDGLESDDESNNESDDEEIPVFKNGKGKAPAKVIPTVQVKKQFKPIQQPQKKMKNLKKNEIKQKVTQKPPVPAKKAKFEKKNQKIKKA